MPMAHNRMVGKVKGYHPRQHARVQIFTQNNFDKGIDTGCGIVVIALDYSFSVLSMVGSVDGSRGLGRTTTAIRTTTVANVSPKGSK